MIYKPFQTNNITVVSYINKEGDMSGPLCAPLWTINLVYQETSDSKARHVPGRLSVVADKLSRLGQTIQTVVSPSRGLPLNMQQVVPPKIDLFATRFNNKLPLFVSPDPLATAVDVLSLPW